MSGVVTMEELTTLKKKIKPREDMKPQSRRTHMHDRKMTMPGITIQNVEPEMRKMLDTAEADR